MMNNGTSTHAAFVDELTLFHSLRGTTLKIPKFNRSPLDLEKLWDAVRKNGGSNKVCEMKHWAQIGRIFGGTTADKNVSNNIKRAFTKWLLPYEREHFPGEAMSSTGEHTIHPTPRRKRPASCQGMHEKKTRSIPVYKKVLRKELQHSSPSKPTVETERTQQELPSVTSLSQPIDSMPPSSQRSFVSIPHLNEAKYYIILLPPAAAADLNGVEGNRGQMVTAHGLEAATGVVGDATPGGIVHNGATIEATSAITDQFRVSLLLNQSKTVTAETPTSLLPNIVVLQQDSQDSPVPTSASRDTTAVAGQVTPDPERCDGQASMITRVPCSGLLCLIDNSKPEAPTQQRKMEQR